MKNEVRLTGYNFTVVYKGVEYEITTDVCFKVHLFPGSINPDPYENNHTPIEIVEFVEQTFFEGNTIGID
jgi:hypothetical protein